MLREVRNLALGVTGLCAKCGEELSGGGYSVLC